MKPKKYKKKQMRILKNKIGRLSMTQPIAIREKTNMFIY